MVKDPNTLVSFMVDTISAVSLLPCFRSAGDKRLTGQTTAAKGTLVPTYETIPLTVTLNLRKSFKRNFLRAGVSCAILELFTRWRKKRRTSPVTIRLMLS